MSEDPARRSGPGPPTRWLADLAASLSPRLDGSTIQGAAAGRGWLSLRLEQGFLWWVLRSGMRLIFWSDRPMERRRLALLGHRPSPLSTNLIGRRILSTSLLQSSTGTVEGYRLHLEEPPGRLDWCGWPKPGSVVLRDADGQLRAQDGRIGESQWIERTVEAIGDFDAAAHHRLGAELLEQHLRKEAHARIDRVLLQRLRSAERKRANLEGDLDPVERIARWRAEADLLAAHLHLVRRGMSELPCTGFDGEPACIALDPQLLPHENLDRAYRRVRRAQAREAHVHAQLAALDSRVELLRERTTTLRGLDPADLDARLDLAASWNLELEPPPDPKSDKARAERLPYWSYRFEDQWRLKVGRSARDNDSMLRSHRRGNDLWLHAQGVAGSHVILCCDGRTPAERVIEASARLAAHFSKARNSEIVPVLCTQKRHVRKPRKSAPGEVAVERERTLFVEPGIDPSMQKVDAVEGRD